MPSRSSVAEALTPLPYRRGFSLRRLRLVAAAAMLTLIVPARAGAPEGAPDFAAFTGLYRLADGRLADVFDLIGQTREHPVVFMPGIVSTSEAIEHGATVTPDGREIWFTRAIGTWGEPVVRETIYVASRRADGTLEAPVPAPFSSEYLDNDPFPSPDGTWIYFVSDRPAPGKVGEGPDLWRVPRLGDGWGEPEHLAAVSSPRYEASPVVTADGDLWFSSMRDGGLGSGDLWRARSDGSGGFSPPENLGAPVSSAHGEWNLLLPPDGSWVIFEASGRPANTTASGDLYLSVRSGDGWTEPVNLRSLNSPGSDLLPRFGPAGTLLFASSRESGARQTDVYAVSLKAVLERYAAIARE